MLYLVQGFNQAGEPEIEAIVEVEPEDDAVDKLTTYVKIDGTLYNWKVTHSKGPVHLVSYPYQGV